MTQGTRSMLEQLASPLSFMPLSFAHPSIKVDGNAEHGHGHEHGSESLDDSLTEMAWLPSCSAGEHTCLRSPIKSQDREPDAVDHSQISIMLSVSPEVCQCSLLYSLLLSLSVCVLHLSFSLSLF